MFSHCRGTTDLSKEIKRTWSTEALCDPPMTGGASTLVLQRDTSTPLEKEKVVYFYIKNCILKLPYPWKNINIADKSFGDKLERLLTGLLKCTVACHNNAMVFLRASEMLIYYLMTPEIQAIVKTKITDYDALFILSRVIFWLAQKAILDDEQVVTIRFFNLIDRTAILELEPKVLQALQFCPPIFADSYSIFVNDSSFNFSNMSLQDQKKITMFFIKCNLCPYFISIMDPLTRTNNIKYYFDNYYNTDKEINDPSSDTHFVSYLKKIDKFNYDEEDQELFAKIENLIWD